MGLHAPTPGLRVVNNTKSPIHTQVVIPIGDVLEVSADVAGQLAAAGITAVAAITDEQARATLVTTDPGGSEAVAKVGRAAKKAAAKK